MSVEYDNLVKSIQTSDEEQHGGSHDFFWSFNNIYKIKKFLTNKQHKII